MPAKSVTPVRHVDDAERRARLARRHGLASEHYVDSVESAARAVVALHATEPASVHLSCRARMPHVRVADVDRALYRDRTLVTQLCMRRTLFVLERGLLPAVLGSIGARMADRAHTELLRAVCTWDADLDAAAWIERAQEAVLAELERGEALTTRQVRERVPEAAGQYAQGAGTSWESTVRLTPKVLALMQLRGLIGREANDADWRASLPRWSPMTRLLGESPEPVDPRAGYERLTRSWLAANGPGTVEDRAWWLGATKADVRRGLTDVDAVPVSLDGGATGWLLPDDVDPVAAPGPWVALLPLLDPSVMGWRDRAFFLTDPAPLFDSVGNAGTTAWVDGRVVGVWVQDEAGRVHIALLERVSPAARRALDAAAGDLTDWLDGQRVFSVYPSAAMRAVAASL